MSDNQNADVQAELTALRAEVERLKSHGETAGGEDPWKGLKEYSKAIEEGRMNDFLYDRSAPTWVNNLGVTIVFVAWIGAFTYLYLSSNP